MKQEELAQFLDELKQLTQIESPTSHIEGVNSVAKWFIDKANSLGLKHKIIKLDSDKVADCLLISNDPEAQNFDILFVGHMDTVFPVGWGKDVPFKENDGKINALGVIDDKAGALLSLYVIKDLDLSKLNVAVFLNSHEETGSNFTKDQIREYAKKSKYCLVMEPAREDGSMVATRKGMIAYTIEFHGVSAHAGNHPERGRSAVVEAANFIVELSKLTDFSAGHTFNAIMTNGGTAQNVVPDFASVNFEMRYKFASSVEFCKQKLDEILSKPFVQGVTHKITLTNDEGPMIDEVNLPKIKAVFDEVAKESGVKVSWVDAGGLSDGNIASSAGCPTIDGLGPTGGNMHSKSEYLVVDSVVPKCNLILDVIKKIV
ncbi:M20/M25/M40 family metallo-hydrolase [Campylobacter sp. RM16188]|uniref:M20/M25/M40 family metallo-hydrolase n=1 Tax=Campylobacter sp. RM16188 TaxID=1705725 RepID=UPI0015536B0D|nr:M20/M25/M40 family metallo-hydrolase [Campylobacter sp. RM16188]